MENNKTFNITYYAKKHAKHITRRAKWDSLSKYWTSKSGNQLITYYDMDAQGYRTAKDIDWIQGAKVASKELH